jgi:hypothetical protein
MTASRKGKPATLRSIIDVELGVMLRAESDAAAVRVARELCPEGTTQAERDALNGFLLRAALAVRWAE